MSITSSSVVTCTGVIKDDGKESLGRVKTFFTTAAGLFLSSVKYKICP